MRRIFFLIISAILIPTISFSENTQEMQLHNGLKIIVREDRRVPIVLCSIWYKVGGSYESNGKTGISHMLEHMMFQGTTKYGPGVFNHIIGGLGGDDNANTSDDYTVYFETVAKNKLDTVFELESDRMQHLLLNEKAFEKEKKVVMEERRMRVDDNPQAMTYERFVVTANPYHQPVIGWMTDIEHDTIGDVRHWYEKWYAPNNAVMVVVGDVKADDVLTLAKKYFGDIPSKKLSEIKPRNKARNLGEKEIKINLPAQLPWLVMGYQVPTSSYTLMVCAAILSGGASARLPADLIRKDHIAVEVNAHYRLYHLHQTLFVLSGTPTPKQSILTLKNAMLNEIRKLQTTLVSQDELNRVKVQLIVSHIYQNDSLMQQAFALGVPAMVGLSWRASDQFSAKVQLVTPEDIRAAAQKYFVPDNLTVAELIPK